MNRILRNVLAGDLPASLVVFLIAVPLSMGIALACNAPVMAGLLGAIVGGVVVGALSGAPLQVSGPANGITVIVFGLVAQLGDWRAVCAITVLAGLVQILAGALRLGTVALAISPAVLQGMLAGIGVQLTAGQLHVMLGGAPRSSCLSSLGSLPSAVATLDVHATLLGLLTIVALVAWRRLPWRRLEAVPAPLVALALGTIVSLPFASVPRVDLGSGTSSTLSSAITFPAWPRESAWTIATSVLALAMITSVESLLSAVGTDTLHRGQRADLDRELVAQGAGNVVSGLIGGLPIAGVVVRSTANITSGARSRAAAILHGVWILVFVVALGPVLELVPRSVLAGLLVFVAANLVSVTRARQLFKTSEGAAYLATVLGVITMDLLHGVLIGMAISMIVLIARTMNARVVVERREDGSHVVRVHGPLSFLGVPRLYEALRAVPAHAAVTLDLARSSYVDHAAREAIESWKTSHELRGGRFEVVRSGAALPVAEPFVAAAEPVAAAQPTAYARRGAHAALETAS